MEIKLTHEKVALVDTADYVFLSRFKWIAIKMGNTYAAARSGPKAEGGHELIMMHRRIMRLKLGDKLQVDHINHNGLDNRRCNLRVCSNQQNAFNSVKSANRSSHYKGVSKRRNGAWEGRIGFCGKTIYLGWFKTEQDAAKAYNLAAVKYFGEFANLNTIIPALAPLLRIKPEM